jgi:hypothetical protein
MNCILKKVTIGSIFAIAAAQLHASTTPTLTDTSLIVSPGNLVSAGTIVTLTANVLASGRPLRISTISGRYSNSKDELWCRSQ